MHTTTKNRMNELENNKTSLLPSVRERTRPFSRNEKENQIVDGTIQFIMKLRRNWNYQN